MKNKIYRAVFFLAFFIIAVIVSTKEIHAGAGCVPVYGGGEQCPTPGNVLIDKKVLNPRTGVYVDNLLPPDLTRYHPTEIVTFQIIVQNSGDQTLDKVYVKDIIPSFVDYTSLDGPAIDVKYDSATRILTFNVNNLTGGKKEFFTVKARAAHQAALPEAKTLVCPVNVVTAETSGQNPGRDESQFCIEKEKVVPTVPSAGPEHWLLSIAGLGMALVVGIYLRKKAIV